MGEASGVSERVAIYKRILAGDCPRFIEALPARERVVWINTARRFGGLPPLHDDDARRTRLQQDMPRSGAQQARWTPAAKVAVEYLYNITSVNNLARIASRGILCHEAAADLRHEDLSDAGVQELRDSRLVAGMPLHQYANLYFNARNAMLYRLHRVEGREVVVLKVSADILEHEGVVVFDGNAASSASRWWPAPQGLSRIDLGRIRSTTWTSASGNIDPELRRITQAEVLVPHVVSPRFIQGFLVPSEAVLRRASRAVGHWQGRIDRWTFFGSSSASCEAR